MFKINIFTDSRKVKASFNSDKGNISSQMARNIGESDSYN